MAKKILVIDDDPELVKVVKSRLEANQYKVVFAFDGKEGLEVVESESPDLILLDIKMPGMDGYTFIKSYKTKHSMEERPILVLTALDGMKDMFELEGVKDYIVKPVKSEDLLEKVKNYLA